MKNPSDFPRLNLPPCRLRVSDREGSLCVWDMNRRKWLVLTPEEWVRRHVISLLKEHRGVPPANITQEYPVELNGAVQRADIVVIGSGGKPLMLVECKEPSVKIGAATLDQAFRYNAVLGARFVMMTNGLDHYIYEVAGADYIPIKEFPDLKETLREHI